MLAYVEQRLHPAQGKGVDLVEAARSGDRQAFGQLYAQYSKMVHGVLLARAPYREVGDLAQEVFALALERIGSLRKTESFGPWLATIARNRATDYHKRAHTTVQFTEHADAGGAELRAEALRILEVIQQLPESYHETLVLRFVEGFTGPEIAEMTGMTHGSVRVNLHRGLALLREKLGERMEGGQ